MQQHRDLKHELHNENKELWVYLLDDSSCTLDIYQPDRLSTAADVTVVTDDVFFFKYGLRSHPCHAP